MTGLEIFLVIAVSVSITAFIITIIIILNGYPILPWSIWGEYKNTINWFGMLLITLCEIIFIPLIYIPAVIIFGLIELGTRR